MLLKVNHKFLDYLKKYEKKINDLKSRASEKPTLDISKNQFNEIISYFVFSLYYAFLTIIIRKCLY